MPKQHIQDGSMLQLVVGDQMKLRAMSHLPRAML